MLSDIFGRLIYLLIKTLGLLPLRFRSELGYVLGFAVGSLPSKALLVTELQIKKFLRPADSRNLARKVFAQTGRTAMECLNLREILQNPDKYISFNAEEELASILSKKKGIVALTAHMANFDAMGVFFARRNIPLLAVAKQLRNPALQYALERLMSSFAFKVVWRANKMGASQIRQSLDSASVVATLIDHDTRVSKVMVPFFGQPASTPKTLVELAKKTNSTIVSSFVVRKNSSQFEIIVSEINSELSCEEILAEFNRRLENLIRQYPDQWNWMHKRWRSLNDGRRLNSREYTEYLKSLS